MSAKEREDLPEARVDVPNEKSFVDSPAEAWAPRPIAVSGPAFLELTPEERKDKRRHQNLGHPWTS